MAKRVLSARVDFYNPTTGILRYSTTDDLRSIQIQENARDQSDDCGVDLSNLNAVHTGKIVEGDEMRVFVRLDGEASLGHIWTGIIDDIESARHGSTFAELPIKAQDFVYFRLATTYVYDSFENMTGGAIVRELCNLYANDVTTASVEDTAVTIETIAFNGISLLQAIRKVAELCDAEWRGDKDKALHFFTRSTKSSGLSVAPASVARGTFRVKSSLAGFGNVIKVRGGSRATLDSEDVGPWSSWSEVTPTTRVKRRVFVSKDRVNRIHVYTDPTGYTGALRVRIQADNAGGTAPVDEANADADLAQRTLDPAFLSNAGWTTFIMPGHITAPGSHAWIIVECGTDADTQRVGLDAAGDLMYRTYYPVPIIVERVDQTSIDTWGRVELPPLADKNIASEAEADLIADSRLARSSTPHRQADYEVSDMDLSAVGLGTTLLASFPNDGIAANTTFILIGKTHEYDGDSGLYRLTHSIADAERLQRVEDILARLQERIQSVEGSVMGGGAGDITDLIRTLTGDTVTLTDTVSSEERAIGTAKWDAFKWGFDTWA